jgi:orotate phosphoribosyltransferase-like protein
MEALHKDYEWMKNAYVDLGKTVAEISDELHISRKLVLIWLKNHGLL